MQPNRQPEHDSTARIDEARLPFALSAPGNPPLRLRPAIARAIASEGCAVADLVCMSVVLVSLALSASGVLVPGNVMALLSMRMSLGHFVTLALCWIVWRTTYSYCGLYTWQHVQSAKGVPWRVAVATGISALVAGQVVGSFWHHGYRARVAAYFWVFATCSALLSRVAIGLFQLHVRPYLRRKQKCGHCWRRSAGGAHPRGTEVASRMELQLSRLC